MSRKKIHLNNLAEQKAGSRPRAMLACCDYSTMRAFSATGIELLLVGDSATNVIYGYNTTTGITFEEVIPLVRGVAHDAGNALVVVSLPSDTYEASDEQVVLSAAKMMHETGAYMVRIEGSVRAAPRIRALVNAGILVMTHIGFTPQSVNALPGFRAQRRGAGAERLRADAHAAADVSTAAVALEMVPTNLTTEITHEPSIPTCDIGAGNQCDGQVLTQQDIFTVPADGRRPPFSSVSEEVDEMLTKGAKQYADQVHSREFPTEAQNFSGWLFDSE